MLIKTITWLLPINRLWTKRPIYSTVSVLFHIGLIMVPLFYGAHVLYWERSIGLTWWSLSPAVADILTLIVIAAGIVLFLMRILYSPARALSRKQDYIWPLLLIVPFITGYICAHNGISPRMYQWMMLVHIYSANLILVMIPFTKIAHCMLLPLSQLVTGLSWKFPAGAGDRVIETLGYRDRPTWIEEPRLRKSLIKDSSKETVTK
jgi:nitrate reductase gamma subunit